jgi:hypothetical protein
MIVMASTHRILPSAACGVRPHCAEMVRILVRQMVRKLREATRPGRPNAKSYRSYAPLMKMRGTWGNFRGQSTVFFA